MIPISRLLFLSLVAVQIFSMGLCITMWHSTLSFTSFLAGAFFALLGIGSYLGLFFYCNPKCPAVDQRVAQAAVSCFTVMWILVPLAMPVVNTP